ncbi:MAG: hypothetical protein IKE56_10595 [Lachnospiraceae bacterium]|nr:hypothetical protein [Lachnospiraceae bacterium]
MLFHRFRPLAGSSEIEDIRQDFRESRKLEKYRLGKKALYFPAGFAWEYLPLSEIRGIRPVTRLIESENGVCPFAMEVPGVRIYFHDKDMVLETEKEKSQKAMLDILQSVSLYD